MPIEFKLRDSACIALAISAAFPFGACAATAGRIDFAIGGVTALATDGQSRPLTKGSDFNSGDMINTGDGRAQLRFTDGSQVSLQPGTQYRIDEYRFSGKNDGEEKGFFSLVKGGFRTITGLIGKADRQAYKVTTATATIGIRGTEFVVLSDAAGVTVSTGEGLVEVCNAAGCIILASGESAVVTDKDGKPVRVSNKGSDSTNNKPTTSMVNIDYSKSDEGLRASLPALPSGPGYAMAMAGTYDGGEQTTFVAGHPAGTATFSSDSELSSFVVDGGEGQSYSSATVAGGFTDGIIGWGRWTAGQFSGTPSAPCGTPPCGTPPVGPFGNAHYIVGVPTSLADMTSLSLANMVGTYDLMGYTLPTAYSGGTTTTGSGGITGSLSADFGGGTVGFNLNNVSVAGTTYDISGSNYVIGGAQFGHLGGSGSVSGGSAGSLSVNGFFVGANAARAGLVYQFNDAAKTISGAAAFKQTGLAAGAIVY